MRRSDNKHGSFLFFRALSFQPPPYCHGDLPSLSLPLLWRRPPAHRPSRPRVQPDAVPRRPPRPGLLPSLLPQPAGRRGRTPGRTPGRFYFRVGRSGRRRLVSQRRHGVPWPELGQVVCAPPPGAAGLRRFRLLGGAWHSVFRSTAEACGSRSCCLR